MTEEVKNKGGRPPKYSETKPQELLELMAKGYKDCQIYATWGICKDTFYEWLRSHPEFKAAHDAGMPLAEAWWENKGLELMAAQDNKAFNYWIAFMNRKFGWSKGSSGDSAPTTQININQLNVIKSKEEYDLLEQEIKAQLIDLSIIDVPAIDVTPKDEF